jgi:hypothetical protein
MTCPPVEHETHPSGAVMAEALDLAPHAKVTRVNLTYPASTLGNHKEWMGHTEHATYGISFESYMTNTGDFPVNVKGDG